MHPETHLTIYQRQLVDLERRLRRHHDAQARGDSARPRAHRPLSRHLGLTFDLHRRRPPG